MIAQLEMGGWRARHGLCGTSKQCQREPDNNVGNSDRQISRSRRIISPVSAIVTKVLSWLEDVIIQCRDRVVLAARMRRSRSRLLRAQLVGRKLAVHSQIRSQHF